MMKNIKGLLITALTMGGVLFLNSCTDPDDLVTANAKEGGLGVPVNTQIGYTAGANIDVTLELTEAANGVEIDEVQFYRAYFRAADTVWSNTVLHATVANSGNEAGFIADYAALSAGLLLEGAPMPATDATLAIADYWQITAKSVLSDGRIVENAVKVKIVVSNLWSGTYTVVGNLNHPALGPTNPYDDDRLLTPKSPTRSQTIVGYFQNPAYSLIMDFQGDDSIIISGDVGGNAVVNDNATGASFYDPADETIHLNYMYNAAAPRKLQEVLTPK